jgi:DNA-binding SARP family transcriptional activator
MPTLRILLLGSPAVYYDDAPLTIQRRVQRTLLFYLATHADPVGRDELLALFWPEEDEAGARRRLREALSKLRAALPDPNLLTASRERVGLASGRVYVDALEFQSLIDPLRSSPLRVIATQPLPEAVFQRLVKAVMLWRAPHFLAGASLPASATLDDWLMRTSQSLEHARQSALERLADHAEATGDPEAALGWLRQALEHDELNEDLHYRVLLLLDRLGRRTEALEACDYLRDLFKRELRTSPSPALQALCERIRQHSTIPPAEAEKNGWPHRGDAAWGRPLSLSMHLPFVGRSAALAALRRAYHNGGIAILLGEAGSGKSRLAQELYLSLEPAPALLLAPARPLENSLPFQPLVELLRHSVDAREWKDLPAAWIQPLSLLLPELNDLRPDLPPAPEVAPETARPAIFEGLRQVLLRLAEKYRLLLFLDNAQWVDPDSLAALAYLSVRGFFDQRGLLALAYRPEEPNPRLDEWLAHAALIPRFHEIDLPPFTRDEIAELARHALGLSPADELVERLALDSGGNPYLAIETLRAMLELGITPGDVATGSSLPLARGVLALLHARLGRLSPAARQAAQAAALAGNPFETAQLEAALKLDAEAAIAALEELNAAGLVTLADGGDPGLPAYRFRHAKTREALLLELSPARAQMLRRRIIHISK